MSTTHAQESIKHLLFFLSFTLLITSCNKSTDVVHYNLTFQEISEMAYAEDKAFCIVLTSSQCPPCEIYLTTLQEGNLLLTEKTLFNIVNTDLPENQWYRYWTGLSGSPVTCVFSPSARLIAVVTGATKNSFDCIVRSLKGKVDCAVFTYNTPFLKSYNQQFAMKVLNEVLDCKHRMEKREDIEKEIEEVISVMPYPYAIYLQAVNAHAQNKQEAAEIYLQRLLDFGTHHIQYRRIYGELFVEAQRMIDLSFDPVFEPTLRTDSIIDLKTCKKDTPQPFLLKLTNTGQKILVVEEISLSCDCLYRNDEKEIRLNPGETEALQFEFLGEQVGVFKRYVIIASNATNPIVQVEIKATVH